MDHRSLNILSLCAGVGGLDLGIRVAQPNARAVCFVEIEAFACEILATRMEDKTMDGSVDCELGNAEYAGSASCQISRSHEEIDGAERSAGGQISPEQSAGADHVADTDCLGTQIPPSGELSTEQWINGNSYPFPPGPEGNWDEIPACFKPAICRMADGLVNRVDSIRACGNGVVPLAAAHAWGILTTAANGGK